MQFLLMQAAAREAGVSADTLRSYCRQGLLRPIRDSSGRRLFTLEEVECIRGIHRANLARRDAAGAPGGLGLSECPTAAPSG